MFHNPLQTYPGQYTVVILTIPIICALIMFPYSFTLSWNEGRGGLLFALAFLVFELSTKPVKGTNSRRLFIITILSFLTVLYFAYQDTPGMQKLLEYSGQIFGVILLDSWRWMWDFIVLALFISLSLFILCGTKFYKVAPAAIIYLAGNAAILSLDAFFPYDTLGPLQLVVPIYLEVDEAIVNWVDKHLLDLGQGNPATAEGNSLVLSGLNGPFALRVYWPSAGIHSLIIYTIVMLVFLLKIEIPRDRRIAYFVIGTFGTTIVNVVRLISLSFFPLLVTTNIEEWEGYHSIAGEIMFLPWLGVYLITIMYIEQRLRMYASKSAGNPNYPM